MKRFNSGYLYELPSKVARFRKTSLSTLQEDITQKLCISLNKAPIVSNLVDFPDEILLEIFSYLDIRDLCHTLPLVNSYCNDLSKDFSLWKNLIFKGNDFTTNAVTTILKKFPNLKRLVLIERNDTTIILSHVCKYNTGLEALVIKRCSVSEDVVFLTMDCLTNLSVITVKETEFCCIKFLEQLHHSLPRLKKFNSKNLLSWEIKKPLLFNDKISNVEKLEYLNLYIS